MNKCEIKDCNQKVQWTNKERYLCSFHFNYERNEQRELYGEPTLSIEEDLGSSK